ncbi:MAG: hypothetical protein KAQ79_16220, partial [Cyclobacteriaceae bacterium]|nr:hypothetical protein [Cyclobacteriaceae bacterium]
MIPHLYLKILCSFLIYLNAFTWSIGAATPLRYINYNFENGSPLHWEIQEDSSVLISLLYDHERDSPNRAAIHW